MLPVERETILQELKGVSDLTAKWAAKIETEGMPMIDFPGDEMALDQFLRALCGELLIAAGRAENLAGVLSGTR